MIKGADLSTLLEVEACGGTFFDHGRAGDAMEILRSYGMNLVRLRLWNDPYASDGTPYGAGTCDLERVKKLARRAKRLGIDWMLDLHYSDFWADPGKQYPPKAWQGMGPAELESAVYDYTKSVMDVLKQDGLLPSITAVGNELSTGLMWPHGRYPHFEHIAPFVSAGLRAVKETAPGVSTMIHLDNGGKNELYRDWFDRYFQAGGEDFDCIGLSYYPFWHGGMEGLRENMNDIAVRYQKDLIVAETSTGFTLEDYQRYERLPSEERKGMAATAELSAKIAYPMTPEGQYAFLRDLIQIIKQVPDGRGRGFIWWEPAWLPVPGSQWATRPGLDYVREPGPGGNEWANQALFDYDGNTLPALELFRQDE